MTCEIDKIGITDGIYLLSAIRSSSNEILESALGSPESERKENYYLLQNHIKKLISTSDGNEIIGIMEDLALSECEEFLLFTCNSYKFDYKITAHIKDELRKLIPKFSLSRIFSFIWAAVKNAILFSSLKECKNQQHAMNTIILNVVKYSQNKSFTKEFERPTKLPRSSLSIVIYEEILGIGDFGFLNNIFSIPLSFFDELGRYE